MRPSRAYSAARTCRRKVRYTDPRRAFAAFIDMAASGSTARTLSIYTCEVCGGLHLGNRKVTRHTRRSWNLGLARLVILRLLCRTLARKERNPCG